MKFKELAKKAGGGDKKSVTILMMVLPEGQMPEGKDPEEYAKEMSEDDSVADYDLEDDDMDFVDKMNVSDDDVKHDDPNDTSDGTGFPDMKLTKGIAEAVKNLDLDDETEKLVCNAIYDGVMGGKIFPRKDKEHHLPEDDY
tara:strand:+ start:11403 stop:11825 length:423 start_codon:yes stop_codon:yes gene_type:complete